MVAEWQLVSFTLLWVSFVLFELLIFTPQEDAPPSSPPEIFRGLGAGGPSDHPAISLTHPIPWLSLRRLDDVPALGGRRRGRRMFADQLDASQFELQLFAQHAPADSATAPAAAAAAAVGDRQQ